MALESNPLTQFSEWYAEAQKTAIDKPNAMTLATLRNNNQPCTRIVLLSSFDKRGYVFHTNYNSHKGKELEVHPQASLLFWWDPLDYQVRIEGRIEKTSSEESDQYFSGRPRGSQIGAWVSAQSSELNSRELLQQGVEEYEKKYKAQTVPRPPHWGGYRLVPEKYEFWIGREDRLHDRFLYTMQDQSAWCSTRLAP